MTTYNFKLLGWQANRSFDFQFLVLGTVDEIRADLFKVLDVTTGQSDLQKRDKSRDKARQINTRIL